MTHDDPLKIKVQLFCGDEIAMGPGKADLLDAIAREGSISGGARAMGMSYRRAWLLVDAMNRCWRQRLVETSPGRARSGGARLTPAGQAVLDTYRTLENALRSTAHRDLPGPLAENLRRDPRPRSQSAPVADDPPTA